MPLKYLQNIYLFGLLTLLIRHVGSSSLPGKRVIHILVCLPPLTQVLSVYNIVNYCSLVQLTCSSAYLFHMRQCASDNGGLLQAIYCL